MALLNMFLTFVTLIVVYKAISIQVRKRLLAALTAVNDIPLLGNPRKEGEKIGGTAVICGGSIAGLLTARVCSDHFENVVIIEPEEWVTKPEVLDDEKASPVFPKRARIPQYATFHGYESFLTLAVRKLFPSYDREVAKAGGRMTYADGNLHLGGIHIPSPWHKYTAETFPVTPNLTRPRFETVLRRLVLATCPNVTFMAGTATGLVLSESSRNIVRSVRIRSRDGEDTLPAALVVDCTGPAMGGFRWLQNLSSASAMSIGNSKSSVLLGDIKVTYDPRMEYSTCSFDVPPTLIPSLNALGLPIPFETAGFLYVNFADPNIDSRNVVVGVRDNNLLQVVCGGWDVRERMTSVDDIKHFLSRMIISRSLPRWLFPLLDLLEQERVPLTCVHIRCPPPVYVQYHLANNIPSNFVALGDSVLLVNPVRGIGVTKACVEAVTLNALLTKCAPPNPGNGGRSKKTDGSLLPKDFSHRYFRLQARRTGPVWNAGKLDDYAWKTTIPAKGEDLERTGRWRRVYMSAVLRLAAKDREVSSAWWHAYEWMAPAADLFSPIIILKLVWMQMQSYMAL